MCSESMKRAGRWETRATTKKGPISKRHNYDNNYDKELPAAHAQIKPPKSC